MPVLYRPPAASGFLDEGGSGGSSVADLIMRSGQAQADAEMRGAAGWSDAIGGATQALSGGLLDFAKRKEDRKVQDAVRAATMPGAARQTPGFDAQGNPVAEKAPGADVRSILDGLPPELQGRAMKGIQDWNEFSDKQIGRAHV